MPPLWFESTRYEHALVVDEDSGDFAILTVYDHAKLADDVKAAQRRGRSIKLLVDTTSLGELRAYAVRVHGGTEMEVARLLQG